MKKALLIVDVQNDFLPGGSLGINQADQIIPVVNELQTLPFDLIIAVKDWHPQGHTSFKKWPIHCVQNTNGSELSQKLNTRKINAILTKGTLPDIDSYSAFFDNERMHQTDLDSLLKQHQILELFIVGLATDYCVKYSCLDALELGYTVFVVQDACKGIEDQEITLDALKEEGARILTSQEVKCLF